METYEDTAIDAVRDWLIGLLKDREWCQARRVGRALEMFVEDRNRSTAAGVECEVKSEKSEGIR